MKPFNLKIQNYYTGTGVLNDAVLSWQYTPSDNFQTAYEVVVSEDCEFKNIISATGKVISSKQTYIPINAYLNSQTKYYCKVNVWDKNDDMYSSETLSFITGVFSWKAKWISNNTAKPFYARKLFSISSDVECAIISVCGLGQFELFVNGKKVSNYVLEGCWTNFNKQVQYYTYDITGYLVKGKNEIFTEIANGWYIGDTSEDRHFYTMQQGYKPFGTVLPFIAQMNVKYNDKTNDTLITDEKWEVLKSATTLANIYGSEDFDGEYFSNINFKKWDKATVLNNEDKPKGALIPISHPPVITQKVYDTVKITSPSENVFIFDLGQNMSGQFEVFVRGKRGDSIKVTPVEKLNADGTIDKTTDTWCKYTLCGSGETEVFKNRFSYIGARWVQIEGCTRDENDTSLPFIIDVKGHFITSGADNTGAFFCSDDKYNKIYNLILKAIESNLNHCHTDCPTIEKLGWLEISHTMAASIMYSKDGDMLWSKIARDMREAQYGKSELDIDTGVFPHEYKEGLIPSIAPRYAKFIYDMGCGSFWDIIPWGSSIILAAYEQYRFYGNTQVIKDNYDAAKKYLDYQTNKYENYNSIYNKTGSYNFICGGLGDWGIVQNEGECRENIETAFYYLDLKIMADFANILNKCEDAKDYIKRANLVKENYNKALLAKNSKSGLWCYKAYDFAKGIRLTQANQAIPLAFGLVPADKLEDVIKSFLETVNSHQIISGEIGLKYIFKVLAMIGRNDIVNDMILKPNHPCYLRFVEMGETTLPEFWRDDARSRNHDMMGLIMEWFYSEVGGINSDDGFNSITISPWISEDLNFMKCSYKSVRGEISVEYKRIEDVVELTIKTPANTQTVLKVDDNFNVLYGQQNFYNKGILNGGIHCFKISKGE